MLVTTDAVGFGASVDSGLTHLRLTQPRRLRQRTLYTEHAAEARLARAVVWDALVYAHESCQCRVLPESASEIAALWRDGAGHDVRLRIVRPAPPNKGMILCMAYQSYPGPRPNELLVSYDALYAIAERPALGRQLTAAIHMCAGAVAMNRERAALLALLIGKRLVWLSTDRLPVSVRELMLEVAPLTPMVVSVNEYAVSHADAG